MQNTHVDLSHLTENTRLYLIYLRVNNATGLLLSNDSVFYPNLQILDLSGNSIKFFSMVALFMMPSLKTLKLSHNPLGVMYSEQSASQTLPQQNLELDGTHLTTFDSGQFRFLVNLRLLNFSHSALRIGPGGF
jgi:Leucine-rich repeat (LRR) protein